MDIRTQRTYAMLNEAFESLLAEKSFEAVSVSELCERSTIRRGTFYRHFQDKYDYFAFYLRSLTERFLGQLGEMSQTDDLAAYTAGMHRLLIDFVEAHRGIVRTTLGRTMPMETFDMITSEIAQGIAERLAAEEARSGRMLPLPADYLARFYANGMFGMLRWWISEDRPLAAEELEAYSTTFITHYLEGGRVARAGAANTAGSEK